MKLVIKDALQDYTEAELYRFLEEFFEDTDTNDLDDAAYDLHISNLSAHFSELVSHPDGNALIFHPSPGRDDSPDGVILEIKEWYANQGEPCFKE